MVENRKKVKMKTQNKVVEFCLQKEAYVKLKQVTHKMKEKD